MHPADQYIAERLEHRKQAGNYRSLKSEVTGLIDFASNDYLGFARSKELKRLIDLELNSHGDYLNGSTGSRLLTGNINYAQQLEAEIAAVHQHEAGLIFNSGYDANVGLFSSLPQRGDTVITDELIHASIIDGIRLGNANRYTFKHNDLDSLEEKLKNAKGRIYIAVESVYSMDGDLAPIQDIIPLSEKYGANLIIDEAHAIGVFGKGLIDQLQLQHQVFARVVTFGKAMGTHGAVVLGSQLLHDYLVNFARSFIYSTAASFHQLAGIKAAYQLLQKSENTIDQLWHNINLLKSLTGDTSFAIAGLSAINCILAGDNFKTISWANQLKSAGFDIRPVLSPTVAEGTERLRICMHSYNTEQEVKLLAATLQKLSND